MGRSRCGWNCFGLTTLTLFILFLSSCQPPKSPEQSGMAGNDVLAPYMCPICQVHDPLFFHEDGICPVCKMRLIERPDTSEVGHVSIHSGSGNFLIEGGPAHPEKLITVFYHRPERFTSHSPILIVVPGAGRDANDYRDAWIEASNAFGVLIISPMYTEEQYDFGAYHLGGILSDINLAVSLKEGNRPNEVILDEELFAYQVNRNPDHWIFNDFDRLFEAVAKAVGSSRDKYDLFGHSAGGQILHRFTLFHSTSLADRILAANSGFYTLPDHTTSLPFGLMDSPMGEEDLKVALEQDLVILLGEDDDETETGGTLLRSSTVDRQGHHRFERGQYFYEMGRSAAQRMNVPFNWSLEVVSGVGHNYRAMSDAAALYLYGDNG